MLVLSQVGWAPYEASSKPFLCRNPPLDPAAPGMKSRVLAEHWPHLQPLSPFLLKLQSDFPSVLSQLNMFPLQDLCTCFLPFLECPSRSTDSSLLGFPRALLQSHHNPILDSTRHTYPTLQFLRLLIPLFPSVSV